MTTETPLDRFKRINKEVAKTALGAETFVLWEYAKTPQGFIATLRKDGWRCRLPHRHVRRSAHGLFLGFVLAVWSLASRFPRRLQ